jgi:hypothetical protein
MIYLTIPDDDIRSALDAKSERFNRAILHCATTPRRLAAFIVRSCGAFNPRFDFAAERPEIDRLGHLHKTRRRSRDGEEGPRLYFLNTQGFGW